MNIQPDLIKKFFSKMAVLAKNGVWIGAFLTEVDFKSNCHPQSKILNMWKIKYYFNYCHIYLILESFLDFLPPFLTEVDFSHRV